MSTSNTFDNNFQEKKKKTRTTINKYEGTQIRTRPKYIATTRTVVAQKSNAIFFYISSEKVVLLTYYWTILV